MLILTTEQDVEVWTGDPFRPYSLRKRSTMRPRNQSELREALDTIGADFEDWYDANIAA